MRKMRYTKAQTAELNQIKKARKLDLPAFVHKLLEAHRLGIVHTAGLRKEKP